MEQIKNYVELHYYLEQHGHAMDAKNLNQSEAEVLKIIDNVSKQLNLKLQTNSLPKKEGGLESFFEFITKSENAQMVLAVGTPMAIFFGKIISKVLSDVISDKIKTDKESEDLKKENLRLRNEKIKKEISEIGKEKIESPELNQLLNELAINLSEANKVKIAKSNLYRNLKSESKVIKFSTRVVNSDLEPLSKENTVPRKDFDKFIIDEAEIEPNYENDIEIPVVAPILKNSRTYWQGIIKGQQKGFAMKDKKFQRAVVQRKFSFENGSVLVCDLETKLSMDSEGEIKEKSYAAYNISQVIYPTGEIIDVIYDEE